MNYHVEAWDKAAEEWFWVAGFARFADLRQFLYSYRGWRECCVWMDGKKVVNGRDYSSSVSRSVFMDHVRDAAVENALTA